MVRVEPKEFRKLPLQRQIHPMVCLFIERRVLEKPWNNGRPTITYYKLRRFFDKFYDRESPQFMNMLYESLWYDEPKPMNITDFIQDAKARQQRLIDEKIKEAMTRKNEKVNLEDVLGGK